MGNAESQNDADSALYGDVTGPASSEQAPRSLRLRDKRPTARRRPPRRASSSVEREHRDSEASARSSGTPGIPRSLAESGPDPFSSAVDAEADPPGDFGLDPRRVAVTMSPELYRQDDDSPGAPATPAPEAASETDTVAWEEAGEGERAGEGEEGEEGEEHGGVEGRPLQQTAEAVSREMPGGNFKKKRSKSADMWRQGSLELSLSDLSLGHMTSTEDILHGGEEEEEEEEEPYRSPVLRAQRSLYTAGRGPEGEAEGPAAPPEEEEGGGGYGAFTLPCRRSNCLSEGPGGLCAPAPPRHSFQGRRAQTTQDISGVLSEGSEYGDSGIDGVAAEADGEAELVSRRCKAMSASFSVCSSTAEGGAFNGGGLFGGSIFHGSDSGSSNGEGRGGGVYENFRKELDNQAWTHRGRGFREEAGSAVSEERSSGTLSTAFPWDVPAGCASDTVRKAGALAVKNFLVHKKNKKVEPATWRKWKHYWVSLKDGRSAIDNNSVPKHALWAESSIVQAVPEHPKKDFVFCLSNSMGDTSGQTELENWVTAVHSACAGALARHHRPQREDTVRLLRTEVRKLEQKIDMDEKMKKMGDMQLSTVTNAKKRKTILEQIFLWEQNLEQFHVDLFRCRCYLASLQGGESPNPKRLLAFASRPTKLAMGRLGVFSVSSFHALVAARTESNARRRSLAVTRPSSKRRNRFSSLWGLDTSSRKKSKAPHPSVTQRDRDSSAKSRSPHQADSEIWVPEYLAPSWVCLPNDQPVLAVIRPGESSLEILHAVCKAHNIQPSNHYLRVKVGVEDQSLLYVPRSDEDISDLVREDEGRLHITEVKAEGLASAKGLKVGDEILLLNGKPASVLQMDDMRAAFARPSLTLSVRSVPHIDPRRLCSAPPRRLRGHQDPATDIFSRDQEDILDEASGLTADRPDGSLEEGSRLGPQSPGIGHPAAGHPGDHRHEAEHTDMAPRMRTLHILSVVFVPHAPQRKRQLSHADKLRKVISELVETEKTYDLRCLIERYLKPLQKEHFLTQDELDILFGNLGEMVEFQVEFLQTLEDGIRLVPNLDKLERVEQFKKVLFSLGGSFLYYADRFKIYSAFCASHTKVPKVLAKAKTDPDFKAFLAARNPRQQHSFTLESYLIKPIQRVLKYPLLIRELHSLTDPDSEEHYHLDVAMKAMSKVASHINEMQKLHEEYGEVFDQLINQQTVDKKEVADLSMGDLLTHVPVTWLNPPSSLVKSKKDPELAAFVFKTAVVFVYKDCTKQRKKMGASHRTSVSEDRDPFRFRHMISTESLQVRTNSEDTAVCEIVHTRSESVGRPERTFQLCCSSPDGKKDFLKAVHSVLREKQRRQLLKTESLPPSQQYVPFGGKRLCALKGSRPSMDRTVSAPLRTLGRRRLTRNRFTIDTDLVCQGGEHAPSSPPAYHYAPLSQHAAPPLEPQGATDRWVEEQLDPGRYGEDAPGGPVKETDILSDDDEYCESRPGPGRGVGRELWGRRSGGKWFITGAAVRRQRPGRRGRRGGLGAPDDFGNLCCDNNNNSALSSGGKMASVREKVRERATAY
ncbi:hypothetical protein NHX12_010236, partial [Muraenolepis orangiensis]